MTVGGDGDVVAEIAEMQAHQFGDVDLVLDQKNAALVHRNTSPAVGHAAGARVMPRFPGWAGWIVDRKFHAIITRVGEGWRGLATVGDDSRRMANDRVGRPMAGAR